MEIKRLAPWNWFKKEEEDAGVAVPARETGAQKHFTEGGLQHPVMQLHRAMDRLFENTFRGFDLWPFRSERFTPLTASGLLKPQVDIGATDKEYQITVEIPGVEEKDIKVEIANTTMIIKGEKRQEKEKKNKNYYQIERSYGSFQRVLSLPEDANQEDIKATFKNGVLTVTMSKQPLPKSAARQIEIKSTD
jgi:HSP20 family protein